MTQDLDQTVLLVSAFIVLLFGLPLVLAWMERSLKVPDSRTSPTPRDRAGRRRDIE